MTTKEKEAKDRRVTIVAGAQGVSGNAVLKQYAALRVRPSMDFPGGLQKAPETLITFPSTY
jgi:hypothetical protein